MRILRLIASTWRRLGRNAGWLMLWADDDRLADEPVERFAAAWLSLMLISLACGISSAALYGLAWTIFGDYTGIPLMPVAVVIAMMVAGPYRHAFVALGKAACGSAGAAGVSAAVVAYSLSLLGLVSNQPDWPRDLPWLWQWIPRTMFRALVLAPVWGGWAMLVVCLFRRPGAGTTAAVAAFARGCGPLRTALWMGLLLGATLPSFRMFGPWHVSIPAIVSYLHLLQRIRAGAQGSDTSSPAGDEYADTDRVHRGLSCSDPLRPLPRRVPDSPRCCP